MMLRISQSLIFGMVAGSLLHGQSLHVSPSEAERNAPGTFVLSFDAPPGKAPVALQWEFSIPPAIVVKAVDITIGKPAESLHKILTCAPSKKTTAAAGIRYACILAGGQSPLPNGALAQVKYRAQADVGGAPIRVAIENVMGASADLKKISFPNIDAMIRIH